MNDKIDKHLADKLNKAISILQGHPNDNEYVIVVLDADESNEQGQKVYLHATASTISKENLPGLMLAMGGYMKAAADAEDVVGDFLVKMKGGDAP